MARTAKQALEELSRPGPHEVLHGDLGLVGLPGLVLTPRSGLGLPAVAFGHGWMQPAQRYRELMRHLASWGIVVAAPATQRGPLASHRLFAADLSTALDVCAGVRLGEGAISVDPERLGLAGHSFGGGCAVLAAAEDERVRAVVTLAPSESLPSAADAARRCRMPALHLAAGRDRLAPPVAHAEPIARAWAGPVSLRTVDKATHLGFTEGRHVSDLLLDGAPERGSRRLARALMTAFFLRTLADRRGYDALLTENVRGCSIDLSRGALTGAFAR
ncbi:dienelactone hydrolase family protein [Streptoalloteichus hindustanus]|uniref:Dienelactone hydrolase n=1 Tax=Streptoalloteichus hindustanus TaxID=2017 RepID=A0A1M4TC34_STRHI|nr:dienelactone hydrolase family protein [Streptoalloteichus hindustanus]SHE42020.1 Dienelactone hydrolase [Streptoalloteichus hindustanus]